MRPVGEGRKVRREIGSGELLNLVIGQQQHPAGGPGQVGHYVPGEQHPEGTLRGRWAELPDEDQFSAAGFRPVRPVRETANATYVQARIREAVAGAPQPPHWFVFDAEGLGHVDATGTDALIELIESLRKQSITFVFARLKDPVADRLRNAGILDLIGKEHSYPTVSAAVDAAPKFAD